jgi:hypothetical protein
MEHASFKGRSRTRDDLEQQNNESGWNEPTRRGGEETYRLLPPHGSSDLTGSEHLGPTPVHGEGWESRRLKARVSILLGNHIEQSPGERSTTVKLP